MTKFQPPKKVEKSKNLSVNVKKFLAKKDEEEKRKALEAKKKRDVSYTFQFIILTRT